MSDVVRVVWCLGSAVRVAEEKKKCMCVVRSEHLSGTLGSGDPRVARTNITCLACRVRVVTWNASITIYRRRKTTTTTPTHLPDGLSIRCPRLYGLVEHTSRCSRRSRKCSSLPNMQGILRYADDHIVLSHLLLEMHPDVPVS